MTTQRLIDFLSSCDPEAEVSFEGGASGEQYIVIGNVAYTRKDIENPLAAPLAPWVGAEKPFDLTEIDGDEISEAVEKFLVDSQKLAFDRFEKYRWDLMIQGPGGGAWSNSSTATLDQIRNIKFPILKPDPEKPKGRVGVREVIKGKVYDTDAPNTEILFQYESPPFLGGPFYNAEMCIDEDGEIFIAGTPAEPHWDAHLGATIVTNGGGIVPVSLDQARQVLLQHGEPGRKVIERLDAMFADRE